MRERNRLNSAIEGYTALESSLNDNIELAELAEFEKDEAILEEVQATLDNLKHKAHKLEMESLLSGEADP